ncbi:hypothetical protein CCACVL1_07844 [Corchorus capsularis]|uniref:Uncharacterized protein n=1 Tax=Corchorus capsularis TaxID=210143 RepID=A0A1R3J3L4_COCAP|nr:hypothetical protein CCACVL1_07844 [Corchorus capsularis]
MAWSTRMHLLSRTSAEASMDAKISRPALLSLLSPNLDSISQKEV